MPFDAVINVSWTLDVFRLTVANSLPPGYDFQRVWKHGRNFHTLEQAQQYFRYAYAQYFKPPRDYAVFECVED